MYNLQREQFITTIHRVMLYTVTGAWYLPATVLFPTEGGGRRGAGDETRSLEGGREPKLFSVQNTLYREGGPGGSCLAFRN